MFELGRRQGLLGEQVEAQDGWALRARAAAIVLVVVVSAGMAWVNTTAGMGGRVGRDRAGLAIRPGGLAG